MTPPSFLSLIEGFQFRKPDDASDEKLLADVQKHGWHIVAIPDDEVGPGFAFTVGLYLRTLQPEVLIMGVPVQAAARVLNAIGEYALNRGDLQPDIRYPDFIDNYEVIFRRIDRSHYGEYLGSAFWFYKHHAPDFPVFQCIWPDPKGIFPHEPGYDQRYASKQIDLSKPR